MVNPLVLALLAASITAAGSVGAAALSNKRPRETAVQKQKRSLVDDLLRSLKGEGSFNDVFDPNFFALGDDAFQKSFIDPAKARFKNQIAPQIQQKFIAGGQQRGTGLDDTLTRAGVDLDQLLNENFLNFQQGQQELQAGAFNRQAAAFGGILGGDAGVQGGRSSSEAARSGLGGFLASPSFSSSIDEILKIFGRENQQQNQQQNRPPIREGFE